MSNYLKYDIFIFEMNLTQFGGCYNLGGNSRYSQCIDIDTREIKLNYTQTCCTESKGKYNSKTHLCTNNISSNYTLCCMKYSSKEGFIGIWSNFTLVEGFMAHNSKQFNCANKKRKHKTKSIHSISNIEPIVNGTKKNLPTLKSNRTKSVYDDID